MSVVVTVPVRTSNPTRTNRHWSVTAKRRKMERSAVAFLLRVPLSAARGAANSSLLPCVVTLTRVAPRQLDGHDNVRVALKSVADQVTEELGLDDDRDPRIEFRYAQERGGVREYAVRIEIKARESAG